MNQDSAAHFANALDHLANALSEQNSMLFGISLWLFVITLAVLGRRK